MIRAWRHRRKVRREAEAAKARQAEWDMWMNFWRLMHAATKEPRP